MAGRTDFLRHIVNKILAERKIPWQVGSDIRKFVGQAEDKYKFSIYGGDPARLAEYLSSRDFDDVLSIFRDSGLVKVAEEILEKVIEAYRDYPEVVEAAKKRLEQLKGRVEAVPEPLAKLGDAISSAVPPGARVRRLEGKVMIEYGGAVIEVSPEDAGYRVVYSLSGEERLTSLGEVVALVKKIMNLLP